MIKRLLLLFLLSSICFFAARAQVPTSIGVQILKAEDARRYDAVLEKLIADPNLAIRNRAALAAGRIGNDAAIPALTVLLEKDQSGHVRAMAAFAIGQIGSMKGADAILKTLQDQATPNA